MKDTTGFRQRMQQGQVCLGTCITFTDPTVTEALCNILDFVWIDMEHNPLTLDTVQGHILATKGTETTPLVRVPWNDPVLIKPVLDIGAAGVIVPLIRTADEARRAVAACLYPPAGVRGFGPRRPSRYGQLAGPEFCRTANENVIVIVQIEHAEALANIDQIASVAGLTGIVIGPNDLAGSMGHIGNPRHPEVLKAIATIVDRGRRANVFVGLALGDDPQELIPWVDKGVQWFALGADFTLLLKAATQAAGPLRDYRRRAT
jgi:2-keto-3-deoxy-L-rhamnonate aldolase RhmA